MTEIRVQHKEHKRGSKWPWLLLLLIPLAWFALRGRDDDRTEVDRAGAVVGLVQMVSAQPRQVAGVVPPARYGLVTGAALAAFLGAAGVRAPSPRETGASGAGPQEAGTLGAAAAALAGAVVAVTCQP